MTDARPPRTIDVTLDGEVLAPPSLWTRLLLLWRALPRGSIPILLLAIGALVVAAVLLVGALLVAVPVVLVLAVATALLGGRRRPPVER